jgi:hypothetical protein
VRMNCGLLCKKTKAMFSWWVRGWRLLDWGELGWFEWTDSSGKSGKTHRWLDCRISRKQWGENEL